MRTWSAGLLAVAMVLASGTTGAQSAAPGWSVTVGCNAASVTGGILTVFGGPNCNVGFNVPFTAVGDQNGLWVGGISFETYVTGPDGIGTNGWSMFAGGDCDLYVSAGTPPWGVIHSQCGPSPANSVHGESASLMGLPSGSVLYIRGPAFVDTPVTAPEPTSLALLGTGLVTLMPMVRRSSRRRTIA